MEWVKNDGGREAAGYKGQARDCVTRSIAIATGIPYQEVYNAMREGLRHYAKTNRDRVAKRIHKKGTTPRNGVHRNIFDEFLTSRGWTFTSTVGIGRGRKVRLREGELPMGRLIVQTSRHLTAVIDGVIHDTYHPSRGGWRCVHGYFSATMVEVTNAGV